MRGLHREGTQFLVWQVVRTVLAWPTNHLFSSPDPHDPVVLLPVPNDLCVVCLHHPIHLRGNLITDSRLKQGNLRLTVTSLVICYACVIFFLLRPKSLGLSKRQRSDEW